MLFAGKALNRRVGPLREYNIPEPVTGGLLFAAAFLLVYLAAGYRVTFELDRARRAARLLLHDHRDQRACERPQGRRTAARHPARVPSRCSWCCRTRWASPSAMLLGRPPAIGVLAGSVSLLGGHGTAIAWAPAFAEQHDITNALEIGVLCATAGLVLRERRRRPAGALPRPARTGSKGPAGEAPEVGVHYGDAQPGIDYFSFLHAILAIHVCGVDRDPHPPVARERRVQAAALRAVPSRRHPAHQPAAARRAARPLAEPHPGARADRRGVARRVPRDVAHEHAALGARRSRRPAASCCSACSSSSPSRSRCSCVFRVLGRNYDAAVISAGFIGFGLGATPTAMANMTAVTQRHGASHVAFLVVPLVGAFFIDLLNTVVIRVFLSMM